MFRQFFDTSFNDYRQVRVVVQELSHNRTTESSPDFQRFCTSLLKHETFRYEQFKVEYCFVKERLTIAESSLNDKQLYRRPFAFIFLLSVMQANIGRYSNQAFMNGTATYNSFSTLGNCTAFIDNDY